jgi:hypothetical protein
MVKTEENRCPQTNVKYKKSRSGYVGKYDSQGLLSWVPFKTGVESALQGSTNSQYFAPIITEQVPQQDLIFPRIQDSLHHNQTNRVGGQSCGTVSVSYG